MPPFNREAYDFLSRFSWEGRGLFWRLPLGNMGVTRKEFIKIYGRQLFCAIEGSDVDTVISSIAFLKEAGVTPDLRNKNGRTPLWLAVRKWKHFIREWEDFNGQNGYHGHDEGFHETQKRASQFRSVPKGAATRISRHTSLYQAFNWLWDQKLARKRIDQSELRRGSGFSDTGDGHCHYNISKLKNLAKIIRALVENGANPNHEDGNELIPSDILERIDSWQRRMGTDT